jgi:cellulose synthase (UDP-forming)
MQTDRKSFWQYREALQATAREKIFLAALIAGGCISVLLFADWWFREIHVASVPLFILLSVILWWGILRMVIIWINYLHIKKPVSHPAPAGKRVAIFTTSSPGEPLSMFDKTLAACAKIKYPHTTYLLDDTRDPRYKEVAARNGAVWLELVGLPGAKAGKINGALKITDEEFILVLDPDHIPFPNFLDEVLGYFDDEEVGYVQVSQAYYNQYRSFTARGAAEQTYGFYGPTQMGLHGVGGAVAIGANCTFRRTALDSIGGHGHGLAEDLVTAIRIHSEGWKSIYAPIVVSRGLVPEDFGSFCKQQLKWARGVHEVLFAEVPRLFTKLTGWQRLSYITIGTYYMVGLTTFIFLLFPFLFFWFGWLPASMEFVPFLLHWIPVALFGIWIYLYVQLWMCHPASERGLHWRGMVLKFACFPVFLLGFLLSLIDRKIPYIPTSKQSVKGFTPFARPLVAHIVLFITTILYVIYRRSFLTPESALELTSEQTWGMVAFSTIAFIMSCGGMVAVWESQNLPEEDPWESVDLEHIAIKNQHRVSATAYISTEPSKVSI